MINIDLLKTSIKLSKTNSKDYKEYSIVVPVVLLNNELHLLYEVRSENLRSQPGEICFPGGKIEKNELKLDAGLRELYEEIGIAKEDVEIIGEIQKIITPFNIIINCYIGFVKDFSIDNLVLNKDEVKEVFLASLDELLKIKPKQYTLKSSFDLSDEFPYELISNGKEYNWRQGEYAVVFYDYKGRNIWGITARITKNLLEILK
ncbi:NUDIX hydrolase [Helicovermis profundi]|uniref:CoA pyrophosphatase n=1 Tax=Helicovermis profundi TaxID=3065157 RepID=A0AAU9EQY4_9FIRM|nr:CoA pyrophosphatase [Clostridia bacterium S502]